MYKRFATKISESKSAIFSGTVNIHPSLLPLYRGAAPVQRALQVDILVFNYGTKNPCMILTSCIITISLCIRMELQKQEYH